MRTLAESSGLLLHQEIAQLRNVRLPLTQRWQIHSKKTAFLTIQTRYRQATDSLPVRREQTILVSA